MKRLPQDVSSPCIRQDELVHRRLLNQFYLSSQNRYQPRSTLYETAEAERRVRDPNMFGSSSTLVRVMSSHSLLFYHSWSDRDQQ